MTEFYPEGVPPQTPDAVPDAVPSAPPPAPHTLVAAAQAPTAQVPSAQVPPPYAQAPAPSLPATYGAPPAGQAPGAPPAYSQFPPSGGVQDTSRNWMGVLALVFGIIAWLLPAVVFGILSYKAVREGKANNRKLATWGMVVAAAWLVFWVVSALLVFFSDDGPRRAAQPQVGDCYVSADKTAGELADMMPRFGDCTESTNAQVFYITTYTGDAALDDPKLMDEVSELCFSDAALATVDAELATWYFVEFYLPNAGAWPRAPQPVVCALTSTDGPIAAGAVKIPAP